MLIFWQMPPSKEAGLTTTFIPPFGCFYFNRLPFGIASAQEHFQRLPATYASRSLTATEQRYAQSWRKRLNSLRGFLHFMLKTRGLHLRQTTSCCSWVMSLEGWPDGNRLEGRIENHCPVRALLKGAMLVKPCNQLWDTVYQRRKRGPPGGGEMQLNG